jgi:hypothetical protein
VRDRSDWGLDDVFLLPIVNPDRRERCQEECITDGLRVFAHYRDFFEAFEEILQGGSDPYGHIQAIKQLMKVNHFVGRRLTKEERETALSVYAIAFELPIRSNDFGKCSQLDTRNEALIANDRIT